MLFGGSLLLLACLLFVGTAGTAAPTTSAVNGTYAGFPIVLVKVNGSLIASDVPGVYLNGRTMVPLRAVAEVLGAEVAWDEAAMVASITAQETRPPGGDFVRSTSGKGILVRLSRSQVEEAAAFGAANQLKDFDETFGDYFLRESGGGGWAEAFLRTERVHDAWYVWRAARDKEEPLSPEQLEAWYPENAIYVELHLSVDSQGQAAACRAYVKQGAHIWPMSLDQDWAYKPTANGSYYGWTYYRIPFAGLDVSRPIEVKLVRPDGTEYCFEWNLFNLK